jgi:putative oxidoreductase
VTQQIRKLKVPGSRRPGEAPRAVILIRLLVGLVFLEQGLQKFLFPHVMGAGRFARIGIPAPGAMAPFVGAIEIACGLMLIAGVLTRLAAVALLMDITAAILATKLPILLGHMTRYAFWSISSEAHIDFAMLMGLLFLLAVGAGPWSVDWWLSKASRRRSFARALESLRVFGNQRPKPASVAEAGVGAEGDD